MNKVKENEFALAELGDKLMQEKLGLEAELKVIDKKAEVLEKKLNKKGKISPDDNPSMNLFFMKFIVENRGYKVMKRLEEIKKEMEKNDK